MATQPPRPPRRGGIHSTYGVFIGGNELDDTYHLIRACHYRFTGQRRGAKVINSIEQVLLKSIESTDTMKFNGSLEKTASTAPNEMDKETFIKELKKKVRLHGQQTFYAIEYEGEVLSLFDHYHKVTVEEVIAQHEARCDEPLPVLDPTTNQETTASEQQRFVAYDEFEFDDFGLSRLVVESLLTPSLLERVFTRFGNDHEFESYPGQVLFLMALDTCNASVQRDIAGAQVKFDALTLDSYPGEDVTELATEALRLIHILAGSYALPLNLGTKLIKKVTTTSSEFFNRKMFALLDQTRTLETKYRLLDPKLIGQDKDYTSFGPYAIAATLQDEHGKLIADADWPALATKLPESNSTEATSKKDISEVQCYRCHQWGHKANDPRCPQYNKRRGQNESTATENATPAKSSAQPNKPKDPWKYVEPKDLTQPVLVDGKEWYFCTKCRCRATGAVGYYQLSHTDESHDPNWRRPQSNLTPVTDPDPTPSAPLRPPNDETLDDDDLVFTGIHCAPVFRQSGPHAEREMALMPMAAHEPRLGPYHDRHSSKPQRHIVSVHRSEAYCDPQSEFVPELQWSPVLRSRCPSSVQSNTSRITSHYAGPSYDGRTCTSVLGYLALLAMQWFYVPVVDLLYWWLCDSIYSVHTNYRYYLVLSTKWMWDLFTFFCRTPRNSTGRRKLKTKQICGGFPAKWLIFTAVMFFPTFIFGGYFHLILPTYIVNWYSYYKLTAQTLATNKRVTLPTHLNCPFSIPTTGLSKIVLKESLDSSTTDITNCHVNTAATVFADPGLELLTPEEVQANTSPHLLHPVIFDTGASLAITGCQSDFLPNTYKPITSLKLGGMASGAAVLGEGDIAWTFNCNNGEQLTMMTKCYHVPKASTRLLSPQKRFDKANGQSGKYWGDEEMFHLEYLSKPVLNIPYSLNSNLPVGYASTCMSNSVDQVNLTLLNTENQNLTSGQKLLLEFHYKFGHTNMPLVQQILRTEGFPQHKFMAASKCVPPKCEICELAKAHRRSTQGHIHKPNPERVGTLKIDDLRPGTTVSVDHFESRLKGRTFDSFGKATSDQYIGGCIFVDHASGYVHIEFQLGFSAIETIRAKQNFEKFAFDNGVIPLTYLTDSGAFKANKFVTHIREHNQKIQYCGTNAHHQNGVAERAIRTISNMARAMILHSSAHWKHGIDPSMWPMAVKYASYLYNTLPRSNGISPGDFFFGARIPRHKLRNLHVWGCPVYVLNPSLQAGKKIPRWEPRSKQGVFCGLSTIHSSEVPQVLNLTTGSITTQFHVVFDDLFTTVPSIEREEDPPSHWEDLCLENTLFISTDPGLLMSEDQRTPGEIHSDRRSDLRTNQVRSDLTEQARHSPPSSDPLLLPSPHSQATDQLSSDGISSSSQAPVPTEGASPTEGAVGRPSTEGAGFTSTEGAGSPVPPTPPPDTGPRRSTRANKGKFTSTRYINEVFLANVERLEELNATKSALAYLAELQTDFYTGENDITDPRVYNAKFNRKGLDPDSPTFHQAMSSPDSDKYIEAMKEEITNLKRMKTWT